MKNNNLQSPYAMHILNNRHEYGSMHNTMEPLKQINKTKFLIPYEQLYIQSHHHHKQLIPEQNAVNTTGLRPTGHAAPYQATGPTPTPPSPINQLTHNLQPANSYKCMQLAPKTASVVPPEDGCLTPKHVED
jgi:hypothetical protein